MRIQLGTNITLYNGLTYIKGIAHRFLDYGPTESSPAQGLLLFLSLWSRRSIVLHGSVQHGRLVTVSVLLD